MIVKGEILSFVPRAGMTDYIMQTPVGNLVMEVMILIYNWRIQMEILPESVSYVLNNNSEI